MRVSKYLILLVFGIGLGISLAFSQNGYNVQTSVVAGDFFGVSPLFVFILTSIAMGFMLGFFSRDSEHAWFNVGVILEFLGALLLQFLPSLEGYFFYGSGDPAVHVGWIITINETARTTLLDIYPALHIIGATFVQLTGIPALSIPPIFQCVFFLTFILGARAVIYRIFSSKGIRRICILMLPAYGMAAFFSPQSLGLSLIPLIVYMLMETKGKKIIALTVLFVGLVVIHPLVSIILAASIFCWAALSRDTRLAFKGFILGGPLSLWLIYNASLAYELHFSIENIALGYSPIASQAVQGATRLGFLTSLSILVRQISLIPLLAVVEILFFVYYRNKLGNNIRFMVVFLIISLLLFPITFLITTTPIGYGRFVDYIEVGVVILSGLTTFIGFSSGSLKKILLAIFLLIIVISSVLTVYESPYTYQVSSQLTENMYSSYSYVFRQIVPFQTAIGDPLSSPVNAWDVVRGGNPQYPFTISPIGNHFSGLSNRSYEQIIIVSKIEEVAFLTIYNNNGTFNGLDFARLPNLINLDLIYNSPDCSFFYVHYSL